MNEELKQRLEEYECLLADGFEDALIGITEGSNPVAVYSYPLCVKVLEERDGMTTWDAIEFMEFNVVNSYVGPKTPIFFIPVVD